MIPIKLQIQHIHKAFKNHVTALEDISFSISQGEFVSVIGPSGAGKTTLFRLLNGTEDCTKGQILIDDHPMENIRRQQKRQFKKNMSTIYQDFCLVENRACLENVLTAALADMSFFPAVLGLYGTARTEKALQLLTRVGLAEKEQEPVKNLSGGQKQRTAIARALMRQPSLLLADEPIASLDPVTGRQILSLLKDIQQKDGVTVLMNSHNLELSMEFSHRLIGLNNGRIVFDGSPDEINDSVIRTIYGNSSVCSLNKNRKDVGL